jgi:Ca2+-binding RTX toxin-like protein
VADEFAIVISDAEAATSKADIVYNSVNGNLFYNSNGSDPGFGTGAIFATLTGAPTLVATDFIIVDGNDTVSGGTGNDTVSGGDGNDYLDGKEGNDYLDGGVDHDSLHGGDGNDYLHGGDGHDSLISGGGNDTLMGGAGNDTLYSVSWFFGGYGDDYLDGAEGNDSVYGGAGDDSLIGGAGNDTLYGGEGENILDGGDGNDTLNSGVSNDYLDGGEDDDTLNSGVGDDILIGGEGSDRFVYSTSGTVFNPVSFGVDVISDFETGTDKIVLDKTTFNSISSPVGTGLSVCGEFATVTSDVDAAASTADIVYNSVNGNLFYNPNGSDPGFGTGDLLLRLTNAPTFVATDFMIEASPLSLYGGAGNDSLNGGDANDYLNGGAGNDSLNGEDANDYLDGGAGDDTLIGGLGSDSFVYSPWVAFNPVSFGVDVISDFETGSDKIVLYTNTFTSISSAVGTGFSVASEFAIVTSDSDAASSIADIVYNSLNGNLFYNPNGTDSGFGTGALFATLVGAPTLVATDFAILYYSPIH